MGAPGEDTVLEGYDSFSCPFRRSRIAGRAAGCVFCRNSGAGRQPTRRYFEKKLKEPLSRELAAWLPDLPRWVETRGMLLSGRCEVVEGNRHPLALAMRSSRLPLAAVAGRPRPESILKVAVESAPGLELLAPPDLAESVREVLPDWSCQPAILHVLGYSSRLPPEGGDVRLLDSVDPLSGLDAALRLELSCAIEWGAAAAAFVESRPVAFCSTTSPTERWWDVSIETLEPYRRRGLATRVAGFMIREMRRQGRQPVWGSYPSNRASLELAASLGFQASDEILVFSSSV